MAVIGKPLTLEVGELARKYGLSEEAVREEIEKAISETFTDKLGFEVMAEFGDDGSFEIWGFREGMERVTVEPVKYFPDDAVAAAMESIEFALQKRATLVDWHRFGSMDGTMVYGEIAKLVLNGDLIVEIEWNYGEIVIGTCETRYQPPHEHGRYMIGERLPFYVMEVNAVKYDGTPRLEILLSRASKRLVEWLLKEKLGDLKAKIKCKHRVHGVASRVLSDTPLPQEAIDRVSNRLNEKVQVQC